MNHLEELLKLAKLEGENKNKVLILGEINSEMATLLSEQSGISLINYKFQLMFMLLNISSKTMVIQKLKYQKVK